MTAMQTVRTNVFDFYFSFHLGLTFAVALIGFLHMKRKFDERKLEMDETGRTAIRWRDAWASNKERGDIPIWVGLLIYLVSTVTYITLTYILVNELSPVIDKRFPLALLLFYGFKAPS